MTQIRLSAFLLAAAFMFHMLLLQRADTESKLLPAIPESGVVLPTPVLLITSLEFKGFVSDLIFIEALVFEGGTYNRKVAPRMKTEEWQWFYKMLAASTDLDPYFYDPYLLANAHLTWEAGLIRETNELLEKGTRYREWDWMIPFYAGFNYFFFLHENTKAAELLVTASHRSGPRERLLSLASRLSYEDKKTENAIIFLESILEKTEEKALRKHYMTRIRALQARLILERAVSSYKNRFGRYPSVPLDIIKAGIIQVIPRDPYGGIFAIGPHGQITSSSDHKLTIGRKNAKHNEQRSTP